MLGTQSGKRGSVIEVSWNNWRMILANWLPSEQAAVKTPKRLAALDAKIFRSYMEKQRLEG
ncbi:MAG: hypothetical protein CMK07_15535 [Ponticaulis sp.]|nr:hypothetical protein [Ponticaulis sp.]